MYQRHYILVLCLTVIGGSLAAKYENERLTRKVPDLPADQDNMAGFIDIDAQLLDDQEGSANSEMDDEDVYHSGMGDDDDEDTGSSGDKSNGQGIPTIRRPGDNGNGVGQENNPDSIDNNGKSDPDIDLEEPKNGVEDKPGDTMGKTGDDPDAKPVTKATIMGHPGILAGIVGGAVVGLLCAVLLVMFIVYRMRKKDEGSYALDEPKRSPSHSYTRAPTKEFYA